MKVLLPFLLLIIICYSCKVSENNIVGTYRLRTSSKTMLVLKKDKTFEFVKNFSEPGPLFFPDSTELNYRTTGNWHWNNGQLTLNSFPPTTPTFTEKAIVVVTAHTDITSFSFWDQYGDPVPIRLIKFPANRTKLHKGNVISFFAQDFGNTDTLEFHFYGYAPYQWINPPNEAGVNNQHRITLFEQNRQGYFNNVVLNGEKNKLNSPDRSFSLFKSE